MGRIFWVLILWLVLAVSTLLQMITFEYFETYEYQLIDYLVRPLASMFTGIALFFLVILPVFDKTAGLKRLHRFFILGILAGIYSVLFILVLHLFPMIFYENSSGYMKSVFGFFAADFHNVLKNYLFQIAILFVFEYVAKETRLITKQKNLEVELNQTRLQILKSQLRPHFLFNTLNSIVDEIDENKQKAQEMLVNLSDLLRMTLNTDFETPVTLGEELVTIRKFLSIEKVRYEEQLEYKICVSPEASKMKLPSMLLQPLVENAIKHGFRGIGQPLTLIIESDAEERCVLVKNNGAKLKSGIPQIGLSNVSERIKIFTGNEHAFQIYQEGKWVINKINLK